MRLTPLPFLILLLSTTMAAVQTLNDIGIDPRVNIFETAKSWEIPYEFNGGCTPFFNVVLESGELLVFEGDSLLLHARQPGKYRVVLREEGLLRIVLKRNPGEGEARLSKESFIACDHVPVVVLEANVPRTWNVGGFTPVTFRIVNKGTADAEGTLVIDSPWNAAPLTPLEKIRVPAGGHKTVNLTMVTVKENNKVLFPRQCFEYSDKYGESKSCVDSTTFTAKKDVAVACIIKGGKVELYNMGYTSYELNSGEILPRSSMVTSLRDGYAENMCDLKVEIQNLPFRENRDTPFVLAAILAVMGIAGVLASEKKLKIGKV